MEKAITIKTVFNPERDTAKASRAAKQLIDIVRQNKWSINVGGKSDHLMYEAWQTVGKYFDVSIATGEAEPVEIGGVIGFKAKAWAVNNKTGVKVGEAEAYCMRDEGNWKSKPTFQLASMAQTRAGSKALRQIFGFVVALAGYSPTPAEEMTGEEVNQAQTATSKQTAFIYKLLKEKGYPEKSIEVKYNVKIAELTSDQASAIIENLIKAPDYVKKENPIEGEIIDNDEVEEGIEKMEHENA